MVPILPFVTTDQMDDFMCVNGTHNRTRFIIWFCVSIALPLALIISTGQCLIWSGTCFASICMYGVTNSEHLKSMNFFTNMSASSWICSAFRKRGAGIRIQFRMTSHMFIISVLAHTVKMGIRTNWDCTFLMHLAHRERILSQFHPSIHRLQMSHDQWTSVVDVANHSFF